MHKINQQKGIIATILIAVLTLSLITFWSKPDFVYHDTRDYSALEKEAQERAKANEEYLKAIDADPEASKVLLRKVISEEDVRAEVEQDLQVNQKIVIPEIADSKLKISKLETKDAVGKYFQKVVDDTVRLNQATSGVIRQMYLETGLTASVNEAATQTKTFIDSLYATTVPKPAVAYHKSQIVAYESLFNQLTQAQDYQAGKVVEPNWPLLYKDSMIADAKINTITAEILTLDKKYGVVNIKPSFAVMDAHAPSLAESLGIIKPAEAFLGGWTITVGDIPRLIREAIIDALGAAFAKFITSFLNKLLGAIEKAFKITNVLYYYDALVAGKYSDDFLNKYIGPEANLDKKLVKAFLPQINCGSPDRDKLRLDIAAKAKKNLGFDPGSVNLNNGSYYQSLNKQKFFKNTTDGLSTLYKTLADDTEDVSKFAADVGSRGPGLKQAFSQDAKAVATTLHSIQSVQLSGFINQLAIGVNNAGSIISSLIKTIITTAINNFVFRGVEMANAVVFQEQDRNACTKGAPKLNPIAPIQIDAYEEPPPIDKDDLTNRCKIDINNCTTDVNLIPPPEPEGPNLQLDKTVYRVGEYPKYKISKGPPNTTIYWSSTINGQSTGEINQPYESHVTDENGNWPGIDTITGGAWRCEDIGSWTKTGRISNNPDPQSGGTTVKFSFTVTDNGTCGIEPAS